MADNTEPPSPGAVAVATAGVAAVELTEIGGGAAGSTRHDDGGERHSRHRSSKLRPPEADVDWEARGGGPCQGACGFSCCGDGECMNTAIPFIGNVLEWYDFAVFGYMTPTLSEVFFPPDDPVAATLSTFSVFAGAFFMRPIGGLIFGHIGDTIGRRRAILTSIILMAVATTSMACLPSYEMAGVAAPVLLTLVRLLQGISIGGQLIGTFVHAVETAPKGEEITKGSLTFAGASLGACLGSGVAALLEASMEPDALLLWGWRLPFAVGMLVGIFTLVFRDRIHEGHAVKVRLKNPIKEAFCRHCGLLTKLIVVQGSFACSFYFIVVWMVTFADSTRYPAVPGSFAINTVLMLGHVSLHYFFGRLIDRTGKMRFYLIFASAALAVLTVPGMLLLDLYDVGADPCANVSTANASDFDPAAVLGRRALEEAANSTSTIPVNHNTTTECLPDTSHDVELVFIMIFVQGTLLVVLTLSAAPMPAWIVAQFDSEVRYTAAAIAHNFAQAIFGGTAPLVATGLLEVPNPACSNENDADGNFDAPCPKAVWVPPMYLVLLTIVSCGVLLQPELSSALCPHRKVEDRADEAYARPVRAIADTSDSGAGDAAGGGNSDCDGDDGPSEDNGFGRRSVA